MPSSIDQHVVEALGAEGSHETLGERIGIGSADRGGMTRAPSVRSTSSKGPENLASRLCRTNRTPTKRSSMAKFLACWVTQAESGFLAAPETKTRRVESWMAKSTYIVLRPRVSTVKKSNARIPSGFRPAGTSSRR